MGFILPAFPKEPILTARQIERLANICDNAGQVSFGVLVLAPIINQVDEQSISMIVSGVVLTLYLWYLSLYLSKKLEF